MERPIRIATIAGSPRPANNTAKALALVENELETPSCAKTRPSRHRRKNCTSRNQAKL